MSDSISRVPPITPAVPVKPVKPSQDDRRPGDGESPTSEQDADEDSQQSPDRERVSGDDERPSNTELTTEFTIDEYV